MRLLTIIKLTIKKYFTKKCNIDKISKELHKTQIYFHGEISLLIPENFDIGKTIITPKGPGIIEHKSNQLIGVRLSRNYYKTFKHNNCYYYAVYNHLLKKFIPLSIQCYSYIIDNNQLISYRITKRGYAMLHKKYMKDHKHIHMFNSKRGGRSMLLHLKKEGYEISLPNN